MIMKTSIIKIIAFLLMSAGFTASAQMLDSATLATKPVYTNLAEALKNPDKVYRLNLRHQKLKKIPDGVFTLTNLQELNLSKNKLKSIPKDIAKLKNLEILNMSSNKLDSLCPEIGQLVNIKRLILNQNVINFLPASISNLTKMYFLDMWGNNIQSLPKEIVKLKSTLKTIDFRVISIKENDQEEMESLLPNTKIFFSTSCNCQ